MLIVTYIITLLSPDRDGALHTGLDEDASADTEITSSGAVLHTGRNALSTYFIDTLSQQTLDVHT